MTEPTAPRCACGRFLRRPILVPPFQAHVGLVTARKCRCGRYINFVRGMSVTTANTVRWLPSWQGWEVFVA